MQLEDTELVTQEDTAEAMAAATDTAKVIQLRICFKVVILMILLYL